MQLLLIRHGPAEQRSARAASAKSDAGRPLTKAGRREMRKAARGMRAILGSLDLVASSPLKRAVETAQILCDTYGDTKRVQLEELLPGRSARRLLKWIRTNRSAAIIALIGHEPDLSRCAGWLLTGRRSDLLEMKKGSACLLEFPDEVAAGKGVLQWLLTRGQLCCQK